MNEVKRQPTRTTLLVLPLFTRATSSTYSTRTRAHSHITSNTLAHLRRFLTMSSAVKVAPAKLGKSTINKSSVMESPKWVELRKLDWTDEDGKERVWEGE